MASPSALEAPSLAREGGGQPRVGGFVDATLLSKRKTNRLLLRCTVCRFIIISQMFSLCSKETRCIDLSSCCIVLSSDVVSVGLKLPCV